MVQAGAHTLVDETPVQIGVLARKASEKSGAFFDVQERIGSMGGRGANSSKSGSRIRKMSDKELDQLYEKTGEKMAVLARRKISADNNPSISSRAKEKTQRDYYQAQRIYNDLRNERDKRADQRRMKRKTSQGIAPGTPFAPSFTRALSPSSTEVRGASLYTSSSASE